MEKKKLVYIDQLVGPTSLDIINALSKYYEVHLYYGGIIKTYADLDPSVKTYTRIPYSKKSFALRFVSWFAFYFTALPFVFLKRKKHTMFLVSNPPLNFFIGYLFGKVFGIPVNLLLWDIYPDIIVQSNYVSKDSWIARHWTRWNTRIFPRVHRIFTVSENLALEIKKYGPADMNNVVIVPNWVNGDEIKPIPREQNAFLKKQGLENSFVVMYSGNMGKTHDIETIVETARVLRDYPDIHFLIIGDGEKKTKITRMVEDGKLTNIRVLPFQEPEMFKSSIASAHVGFVTLSDGFENYSVPSKTYYLMAAGCIIFAIANEKSELNNLIRHHQFGFRFDPGDSNAIAGQILKIYKDRQLLGELARNSRQAASHFTIENANIIAHEVTRP